MVPAAEVGDLRDGLRVQTRVNGETVQDGRTDEMVYTVGDTLSLISHTFTLRPGDLLATGTPSGVGYARTPPWLLQPGDVVEVEVERLGVLTNPVVGNDAAEGLTDVRRVPPVPLPARPPAGGRGPRHGPVRLPRRRPDAGHVHRRPGRGLDAAVPERVPRRHRGRHPARGPVPARRRPAPGEEAPVEAMVAAAHDLLAALDDDGRERISFAVDAVEWQTWANPEFMQFDTGLRLDLQPAEVREKALALMRASLSPEGYDLAHAMMLINGFLGEVVDLETVLNEFSYNIALYGEPDLRAPWGWQLFGHHCAVNCLVVEGRMVRLARSSSAPSPTRSTTARTPASPTSSPTASTWAPR